jgi:hypothetical protein
MQNPKYSTGLGLLLEANKKRESAEEKTRVLRGKPLLIYRVKDALKSVFKEIF